MGWGKDLVLVGHEGGKAKSLKGFGVGWIFRKGISILGRKSKLTSAKRGSAWICLASS